MELDKNFKNLCSKIVEMAEEIRNNIDKNKFRDFLLVLLLYRCISENIIEYINKCEREAGNADFDYVQLEDYLAEDIRAGVRKVRDIFLLPSEVFENIYIRTDKDDICWCLENLFIRLETIDDDMINPRIIDESMLFGLFDFSYLEIRYAHEEVCEIITSLMNVVADMPLSLNEGSSNAISFKCAANHLFKYYGDDNDGSLDELRKSEYRKTLLDNIAKYSNPTEQGVEVHPGESTLATSEIVSVFPEYGNAEDENYIDAYKYFLNAVAKGKKGAAYDLAHCYHYGTFCKKDQKKADEFLYEAEENKYLTESEWLEQLAKKKVQAVKKHLGSLYNEYGLRYFNALKGKEVVHENAWYWLSKAQKLGYSVNENIFNKCVQEVKKRYTEKAKRFEKVSKPGFALEYWLKVAECGDEDAQRRVSSIYARGTRGWGDKHVRKNPKQAELWLKRALENELIPEQRIEISKLHYDEGMRFYLSKHYTGNEVSKYTKAAESFARALSEGYASARDMLGKCYREIGYIYFYKKDERCFDFLKKAASCGIRVDGLLGTCYFMGLGTVVDYKKAEIYHLQQVADEDRWGEYCLGLYYHQGKRIIQDDIKAVIWWRRAAEKGCIEAMDELAFAYFFGRGVDKNKAKALQILYTACHRRIVRSLQKPPSECWMNMDERKEIVDWLKELEKANNVMAINCLANYYLYIFYPNGMHSKCVKLYEKASAQGDLEAKKILSDGYLDHTRIYYTSYTFISEVNEKWYQKLLDEEDYEGAILLGDACLSKAQHNYEADENYQKAFAYYSLAAEHGNLDVADRMYFCYKYGIGTEKDEGKAKYWLEIYQKDNGLDF